MASNAHQTGPLPTEAIEAIEAAEGPADDSEFEPVEWDASSADSASLSSSVHAHEYEFGRRYHSYRHGRYPLPNDETEKSREDMKHAMMLELTNGKLFYSPIGKSPGKIIDIGTGTGTWAIEVAEQFPEADVLGIDLSPIQPTWVPPNVKFYVDDAEDDWLNGDEFDFVHFRTVASVLKNLDKTLGQCYNHMKPGAWVELQELHIYPQCDDDTVTEGDELKAFYDIVLASFLCFGANLNVARDLRSHLEGAGFKDIRCEVKKVPIGTWPKDEILRLCGLYLKKAILEVLPAFHKLFEANGLSSVETEVWLATARKELEDRSKHRYFYFYFWYAQKPENAPEQDGEAVSPGGEDV
ncbi:Secondary metabolism regulator LAE1 [Colletotrichum sidae]|uniref:Secondary metabolism regulator LAE1 n=1 Tax=Colletotrichum sidae TaxID=1347389 RepID=A0A4V3I3R3_9PEZI|nr:Secondary metabolism regulator LAE1 [Colletotrichum sidae]